MGPEIVLSEEEHHFGNVMAGDIVRHTFKLKNTGDEELKIEDIKITGIFTKVILKRLIPPKQEINIILTMDTDKLSGEVEAGVILRTNDPVSPWVELKMRGLIIPVIDIQPMADMFFSVYEGQAKEDAVIIVNNTGQPLKITKIEYESQRFEARMEPIKEGKEYTLLVKVNPDAQPGRTMEKVTLFTDNNRVPQVVVGVNIFIKRDVYTFPDEVNFGTIDLEKLNQNPQTINLLIQTVLVKRREGKGTDFQIKLEYNIPFISIKKEPENQSETYRLDVSLMPERMTRGKIDTLIRVLTNDKEVPEIRIPVVGEIW